MIKFFKVIFLIWWIPTLWGMKIFHACLRMTDHMGYSKGKPYDESAPISRIGAFLAVMFIEYVLVDRCLVSLSERMGFEYTSLLK